MAFGWIRWTGAADRARAFVAACKQSLSGEADGRRRAARALAIVPVRDGSDTFISERADRVDRNMNLGSSPTVREGVHRATRRPSLRSGYCPGLAVGLLTISLLVGACNTGIRRSGIPAGAQ